MFGTGYRKADRSSCLAGPLLSGFGWARWGPLVRLLERAAVVGARLERSVLHPGDGRVDEGLGIGRPVAAQVVTDRHADAVVLGVVERVARRRRAARDRLERRGHRQLEVLLGACQQARTGIGIRVELVDIDADAEDLRRAGGVEDAVTGETGDLEQDVDILVLGEEVLGERLATGLILEGGR